MSATPTDPNTGSDPEIRNLAITLARIEISMRHMDGRLANVESDMKLVKTPKSVNWIALAGIMVAVLTPMFTAAGFTANALLQPMRDRQLRFDESLTALRRDVEVKQDYIQRKLDTDFGNYKDRQAQENRWFFDSIKVRQESWQWALERVWAKMFNEPLPEQKQPKL